MAMATTPIDRNAMLLAAREWERGGNSPSMERGLLLELIGLCELVGTQLYQKLEGRRRVGLGQLCTAVREQWTKQEDTRLTLALPTRLPSQESCIADWMALALAVVIVMRLLKKIGPGRSRSSRRIRQRQVFQSKTLCSPAGSSHVV